MTAEDRLRDLLREEAATVVPAGDGLARIQERIARKRRHRLLLVPAAALAAAGAAAAVFVLGGGTETQELVQDPATQAPTSQPSPGPAVAYDGPAIWPFTTAVQAAAWKADHGTRPWAGDPEAVAQHFVTDFANVQASSFTAEGRTGSERNVVVQVGAVTVSQVRVAQLVLDGPWTVTQAVSPDLRPSTPTFGAAISSPTSVSGTFAQAVDENVRLQLVTSGGTEIAATSAPAGSAVPWQGALTWSDQTWTSAGIVATTASLKDGSLTRLMALPVTRAAGTANPAFAGLSQGHIGLFDAVTGAQVRQLTYPPANRFDTGLAWNGSTLVWVRSQQTGCADELDRLTGGTTSTLVTKGTAHLGTPRLSPDGSAIAFLSTPCAGGAPSVVVQPAGAPALVHPATDGTEVADVRDDGTVLVTVTGPGSARTLYVVPATAGKVDAGTKLQVPAGCTTYTGAFDGSTPTTWETCGTSSSLARYDAVGGRTGAGSPLPTNAYALALSFRDGAALAWLSEGATLGRLVRVEGGALSTVLANTGCPTADQAAGCVRAPSW